MKCLRIVRNAAVALAAIGTVVPNAPAIAESTSPAISNVKVVNGQVLDIALSSDGIFRGRVVDHTGAPMEGAEVTVLQNKKEIVHTVTDKNGSFTVSNMKNGIYTVASGATEGSYRVWSEQTAPPSAKQQGLLVLGQNGKRGNFGGMDLDGSAPLLLVLGTVGVAGLIVGSIGLSEANRANSRIPSSP